MRNAAKIAVIVPAFNEERLIRRTLSGMPPWVDAIIVVDDASQDQTRHQVAKVTDRRVQLVVHERNLGVGAAIATGYRRALRESMDVMVVMAGDNQMDPDDLGLVVGPILDKQADYVKGNRFVHPEVRRMPWLRRLGGRYLSALTRLTTGLPVHDAQCGYTALGRSMLERLPLESLWPSFGYPNDLLALLAGAGAKVAEVPVRPVYAEERSGIRAWHVLTITRVILSRWFAARRRSSLHRNVNVRALVINPVETCGDSEPRQA
ncbi:MAG: glycosyltransferase family 2 protein [Polyangiaceae bacterium]|nr:glycosyltransferase family 2 protein [Polyangiaceae bacterium]